MAVIGTILGARTGRVCNVHPFFSVSVRLRFILSLLSKLVTGSLEVEKRKLRAVPNYN